MINQRVAILFPADAKYRRSTDVHQSKFAGVPKALCAAGIEVVGVPLADDFAEEIRAEFLNVNGVLVWVNPIHSSKGIFVSAHPEVIAKMGTKEVLYRTAKMSWGCDTRLYAKMEEMQAELPALRAEVREACDADGHFTTDHPLMFRTLQRALVFRVPDQSFGYSCL